MDHLGTVLTLWAHPDDETYLVGGLSAQLTDAGHRVVCVTATRGEAGVSSDPACLERLAQVRTAELDEDFGVFELGRPRVCADDELDLLLELDGATLDRKVAALLQQVSQTAGLVEAVGLERFRAWVASESFAEPQPG